MRITQLRHRQRGISVSVLVCLLIPVLLLCVGLAVDGAAKAAADRRAEAVAAQAARAGMDAAGPYLLTGADGAGPALAAANQVLASHPEVSGQAVLTGDASLLVTTTSVTQTTFLGLVGIDQLIGRGQASVDLRERG